MQSGPGLVLINEYNSDKGALGLRGLISVDTNWMPKSDSQNLLLIALPMCVYAFFHVR